MEYKKIAIQQMKYFTVLFTIFGLFLMGLYTFFYLTKPRVEIENITQYKIQPHFKYHFKGLPENAKMGEMSIYYGNGLPAPSSVGLSNQGDFAFHQVFGLNYELLTIGDKQTYQFVEGKQYLKLLESKLKNGDRIEYYIFYGEMDDVYESIIKE